MDNKEENAAKEKSAHFGEYPCQWCGKLADDGKSWISTSVFPAFVQLIDHLVVGHAELGRRFEEANRMDEEVPYTDNHFIRSLRTQPLGSSGPAADAKQFLPAVADWLEPALQAVPGLDSTNESSILVASDLIEKVRKLGAEYLEQRNYLLENEEALRDTAMDPKWPRRLETQSRFVADSMAGARWGYKPTSSREFIRKQRPKEKMGKVGGQKEGRWWEISSLTPQSGNSSED